MKDLLPWNHELVTINDHYDVSIIFNFTFARLSSAFIPAVATSWQDVSSIYQNFRKFGSHLLISIPSGLSKCNRVIM